MLFFRLPAALLLLLSLAPAVLPSTGAQPRADAPSSAEGPVLERGERFTLLASPRFTNDDLGGAYPVDLNGLTPTPLLDGPVQTVPGGETRTWFRRQTNDFGLNVEGTATGMINARVPVGDRRSAGLTIYKIDRIARIEVPETLPASPGDDASVLLTEIHYGWAFQVVIVGTTETFTRAVADRLRRRIEAGRPIEPLLRRHDLSPVVSSRGLGFGMRTPMPDRLPLTWEAVEARYDLGAPEPVLAEYALLRDVHPAPIAWAE